ncbi:multi-sensor signal transduction histidine kinase [Myxococcus stipitatus DSM 14675]|uniref:histidine kinase n=1 Tax=Myxococcus stipitatus (strain DSM 14675 / JCM 12634 / Mx s8) TaxID=1278073 RepID=L7ULZ9_MYXSD|nr:HAMP domain-containing sensor histidine kinase [Myxococcus stipitatus]AGC47499.1 multi-sensor signal transduction histidine kinase [Myxococcus stipitatus DSM 14675]
MRDAPDLPALDGTRAPLLVVGASFLVQRPLVIGPLVVLTVGLLHASGAPREQTLTLLLGAVVMFGVFLVEALRFRTRPVSERYLSGSLLFTGVGITVVCGLTGGVRSPLLSLLFVPSVVASATFGRSWRSAFAMGTLLTSLGGLFLWSSSFPPIESPWVEAMTVCAVGACTLLLHQGVSGLTRASPDTTRQLDVARQESREATELRAHTPTPVDEKGVSGQTTPDADTSRQLDMSRQEPRDATELRAHSPTPVDEPRVSGLTTPDADTSRQLDMPRQESREATKPLARTPMPVDEKVARDIENRLASVRTYVEVAAETSRSSRVRQRLSMVMREVTQLDDILRNSLGLSRPKMEPRRENIDIQQLLLRTSMELESRARARDVVVSTNGPPLLANVDPRRLEEALFNLLANAVGACAHGAEIEAHANREADGVSILIGDGGHDMPPRLGGRASTPFFTMQEQATGLGVTLARSVAREHGGSLTFERAPGRGMRAKLWLPGA